MVTKMKKLIHIITVICLVAATHSCKKDGMVYALQPGVFGSQALSSSASELVLSPASENEQVVRFDWSAADFSKDPIVTYTLELDTPADTLTNNWAGARQFVLPYDVFSFGFKGKDLNSLLNEMGLAPDQPNNIVVRVRADLKQYNGAASPMAPAFTNVQQLAITSYGLSLYVPGEYQGWNPGAAPTLAPVPGQAGKYHGYVNFTIPGKNWFKYTNAPDWDHTNYGDGGNGSFSTDGNAAGLSVEEAGYYYLTADLNTNTWTATKTTWGVIGDASPGSWDSDTQLSYDAASQTWSATVFMKQAGSWKFRANNNWALNMGLDNEGRLQYADNAFLGYVERANLTVPEDATYIITLDLHVPGVQNFTLIKQ